MNLNSQFALNKLQSNLNYSNQTLVNRLAVNFNNNNAAVAAAAALNMKSSLGQQQQQQQQANLFDNFGLNQNFNNNNFGGNYVNLPLNFGSSSNLGQKLAGLSSLNNVAYTAAAQANPTTCNLNNTLFVGNLHASLQEIDLIQVFRPFGRIVECCKKWLHFGFVKFTTEDEACHAYVTLNGFRLKGRPMRLEFQNRTKKARIKAILAQAALQANTGSFQLGNEAAAYASQIYDEQSLNAAKLNNGYFQAANPALSHATNEFNSFYAKSSAESTISQATPAPAQVNLLDSSFFNPDQLIKFAKSGADDLSKESTGFASFDFVDSNFCDFKESDRLFLNDFKESFSSATQSKDQKLSNSSEEIIVTLTKKALSPSDSPTHDICSSLSVSSDSGCRSASFLNDEDSAIASLKSVEFTHYLQYKSSSEKPHTELKLDECTISEQVNFTCSNSSPVKESLVNLNVSINEDEEEEEDECNTSCDTSDDASEIPTDSDCLNELDLIDENLDICNSGSGNEAEFVELSRYNQVMEKDGTVVRKKLEYGIYKSVNHTLSLFIEPNDVLKQLEPSEYDEYVLFPNEVDPYLMISQNQFYLY